MRGGIHHGTIPLECGPFTIFPLSILPEEFKRRAPAEKELSRSDFIDRKLDEPGWRVRIDLMAGYVHQDAEEIHMFVAAETPNGNFVETMEEVVKVVDENCVGKWCFHNKAFWFENETDALLINAYVFS